LAAIAGNNARGWASTIAHRSTTNVIRTFGDERRYRSPSNTDLRPARGVPASGGILGRRSNA
jgi:hypothetical protein